MGIVSKGSAEGENLIPIPEEKFNDYQKFIKMFNKEDSDETRRMFLNMI